jgi:hypothetical protein
MFQEITRKSKEVIDAVYEGDTVMVADGIY